MSRGYCGYPINPWVPTNGQPVAHVALVLERCIDLQKFIEAININIPFPANQAAARNY
jgi:hypothetical protein